MSRRQANKTAGNPNIYRELADRGIIVRSDSPSTMKEEVPETYRDVRLVVDTCECARISKTVARLRPLVCVNECVLDILHHQIRLPVL